MAEDNTNTGDAASTAAASTAAQTAAAAPTTAAQTAQTTGTDNSTAASTAQTAADPAKPGAVLSPNPEGDAAKTVVPDFPEDWRVKIAGDDKKLLSRLDRFASPKAVIDSYLELEGRVHKHGLKQSLPENPTPEQVTQWRKENGIPETAKDYKIELKDYVVGDAQKPLVDFFVEKMHSKNANPEVVQEALNTYFELQEQEEAVMAQNDNAHHAQMEDHYRKEWGADYRGNLNAVEAFIEKNFDEDTRLQITNARLPNGIPLRNFPGFIDFMTRLAKSEFPGATITGQGGQMGMSDIESEMKAIEAKMGTKAYAKDEGMQQRYGLLMETKMKIESQNRRG